MVQAVHALDVIPTSAALVAAATAHVQQELLRRGVDASHDWTHIERVARLADRLLGTCQPEAPDWLRNTVALCATLHDIADWKYCDSEAAGIAAVKSFLCTQKAPDAVCDVVNYVLDRIGFKESLPKLNCQPPESRAHVHQDQTKGAHGANTCSCPATASGAFDAEAATNPCETGSVDAAFLAGPPHSTKELALKIVQDADRLDALGAIGVARCLTFGGRFKRTLYDPAVPARVGMTKEQYTSAAAAAQATTMNHFHEKLFLLEGLMNTRAARRLARARTQKMQAFLQQFEQEWMADDLTSADAGGAV